MDINFKIDKQFNETTISASINNFLLQVQPHIRPVLNEIVIKLLNQIVLANYDDLHSHINNIIASKETRDFIEKEIRNQIKIQIDKQVKDLFGDSRS